MMLQICIAIASLTLVLSDNGGYQRQSSYSYGNPVHQPFQFPSFQDFFGSFSNNRNNYGNSYNRHGPRYQRPLHGHARTVCPEQTALAEVAGYSSDFTLYPVNEITAELAVPANLPLLTCLQRTAISPDLPDAPVDTVLGNSTASCGSNTFQLASFPRYAGRCWVLRNVQEKVLYSTCKMPNNICNNCTRSYNDRSISRCLQSYDFDSVWTYCDMKPLNQRIGVERIAIPTHCDCRKIKCQTTYVYHK